MVRQDLARVVLCPVRRENRFQTRIDDWRRTIADTWVKWAIVKEVSWPNGRLEIEGVKMPLRLTSTSTLPIALAYMLEGPWSLRHIPRSRMADALQGAHAGRTEFRQILSASTPKLLSEPIPVPSGATGGRWSPAPGSCSLPDNWTELGPMLDTAAAFPTLPDQESPENSSFWCASNFVQNGFAEFLPSSVFQRSLSSHSLERLASLSLQYKSTPFRPFFCSPVKSAILESEFSDVQSSPPLMRKVFSAGDLQCLGHESGSPGQEIFGNGMQKVARYNAEEKKERIQRYRSKRNQRNFNKKITYACRKTLADSRPRVRGRFARNEEQGEDSAHIQWNQIEDDEDEIWMHLFDGNYIPIP